MDDLTRLAADLNNASGRIGAQAAQVLRKTALDIEATGKQLAPVDTGALRSSIGVDYTGDGRHGTMSAQVGPTVHYGPHVEYGTSRAAAQPYMRPAATQHEQAFVDAISQLGGTIL
jgi:HK97 gp10 family phage protein